MRKLKLNKCGATGETCRHSKEKLERVIFLNKYSAKTESYIISNEYILYFHINK